jgi:hypothetical protein
MIEHSPVTATLVMERRDDAAMAFHDTFRWGA